MELSTKILPVLQLLMLTHSINVGKSQNTLHGGCHWLWASSTQASEHNLTQPSAEDHEKLTAVQLKGP